MLFSSDADTCDLCKRRPEVGVYAVPFVPLSLGYCQTCLDNSAFPEGLIKWVLGMAPGDSERRTFFEVLAQIPDGDAYRRLTSEQINEMESEGRRRLEELDAQIAEAKRSRS